MAVVPVFRLMRLLARASRRDPDAPPMPMGQVIGIIAGTCLALNAVFFLLSGFYFEDRAAIYGAVSADHISAVRLTFALFTGVVGAASIVTLMYPMAVGLLIATLASIGALVGGVAAAAHDMTPVLPASLIVTGLVMALLIWQTLEKRRAAWAFLIGMTSVLSAVLLFGATKMRNILDIGLWTALIIPGLLAVATAALSMLGDDYRDA